MSKRKCKPVRKCRSVKNILESEWQRMNKAAVIIGGALSLTLALITAAVFGGYEYYNELCLPECAPASFLFPIVWSLLFILIGAAAGGVVSNSEKCLRTYKNRGLLYFTIMFALSLLFTPFFFGANFLFISFLILTGVTALCFFVIICFLKIYLLCAAATFVYWLWLVFMMYLNLAVLFLN